MENAPVFLLDKEYKDIVKFTADLGEKPFRAHQLYEWLYKNKAVSFDECKNLPAEFREKLKKTALIRSLKLEDKKISADGTVRYEFLTLDGKYIYAVFLPSHNRSSVCLSTQVGCPVRCSFCASGRVRFARNLSRGEIIEQVLQIENDIGKKVSGVLFMGMGEPLANYVSVVGALKVLRDPETFNIGRRHITVSTSGIVPEIRNLLRDRIDVRLAVSLHAPDDDIRVKLVPIASQFPIEKVLDSAFSYAKETNTRLTIEYILIKDVNDTQLLAKKLAKLINKYEKRPDEVQVNLIPYNNIAGGKYESPSQIDVEKFKKTLLFSKILVMVRQSKGSDIGSACGQLGYAIDR